jgi:hypothetical protein
VYSNDVFAFSAHILVNMRNLGVRREDSDAFLKDKGAELCMETARQDIDKKRR